MCRRVLTFPRAISLISSCLLCLSTLLSTSVPLTICGLLLRSVLLSALFAVDICHSVNVCTMTNLCIAVNLRGTVNICTIVDICTVDNMCTIVDICTDCTVDNICTIADICTVDNMCTIVDICTVDTICTMVDICTVGICFRKAHSNQANRLRQCFISRNFFGFVSGTKLPSFSCPGKFSVIFRAVFINIECCIINV